jgi:predicted RNA binding protein YcfA (HicA-like mRNA interferase family)
MKTMPLDRRVIEKALQAKGFVRLEGDHTFFIYHSVDGKKTPVRTKTSHGSSHKEIGDGLVGTMAKQCRLTGKDFKNLIDCSLSQQAYEEKLLAASAI